MTYIILINHLKPYLRNILIYNDVFTGVFFHVGFVLYSRGILFFAVNFAPPKIPYAEMVIKTHRNGVMYIVWSMSSSLVQNEFY